MKVFVLLGLFFLTAADKESPIPVSDTGEGTKCDADMNIAQTCLACSRLPQDIAVQLTDCCGEEKAYKFCQICTKATEDCLKEAFSINKLDSVILDEPEFSTNFERNEHLENLNSDKDDDSDSYGLFKRFGSLGIGGSRGYIYGKRDEEKRFGRLNFGGSKNFLYKKRNADKRYGSIGMSGSRDFLYGKRDAEKRYGYLGLGSSGQYIYGKRDTDKRFGTLGIGGSSDFLYGKRDSDNNLEKRYWKLGMRGSRGGYFFGKRNSETSKRYGQLGMGSSGSYLYDKRQPEKRFGKMNFQGSRGFLYKR